MSIPPAFALLTVGSLPRLWLPLFLLWPLLAVLFALLALLIWLAALEAHHHEYSYRRCFALLWQLFCALRGFQLVVDPQLRLSLC